MAKFEQELISKYVRRNRFNCIFVRLFQIIYLELI